MTDQKTQNNAFARSRSNAGLSVTLTGYLQMISDFWAQACGTCEGCEMYDEEGGGYCAMFHDRSVPNGDCRGLLEIGIRQPAEDMTPNVELTGSPKASPNDRRE